MHSDWLKIVVDAIASGREFIRGEERYQVLDVSRFRFRGQRMHRDKFCSRAWVEERLVWIALHDPGPLRDYASEVVSALPIDLSVDLEARCPELLARARREPTEAEIVQVIVDGLFAGVELYGATKEGYIGYRAMDGGHIEFYAAGDGGRARAVLTREEVAARFRTWAQVVDGVAHFRWEAQLDLIERALDALTPGEEVPTLRAYLVERDD